MKYFAHHQSKDRTLALSTPNLNSNALTHSQRVRRKANEPEEKSIDKNYINAEKRKHIRRMGPTNLETMQTNKKHLTNRFD